VPQDKVALVPRHAWIGVEVESAFCFWPVLHV
jgi:hypothetical protein